MTSLILAAIGLVLLAIADLLAPGLVSQRPASRRHPIALEIFYLRCILRAIFAGIVVQCPPKRCTQPLDVGLVVSPARWAAP